MILFTHTDIFKIYMYLITRNSNLMKDITKPERPVKELLILFRYIYARI